MTFLRTSARPGTKLAVALAATTLALTACGGGTTEPGSTTGTTGASASTSASGPSVVCPPGKVNGGGSSAQDLAMQTLTTSYNQACSAKGTQVIYTKSGSGQGIKDFYNSQLQFAGSDSALSSTDKDGVVETDKVAERCQSNPGWNLPLIAGPVSFAYKLKDVNDLVLTPEVITNIFLGKITMWNDPAIAALNSGKTLPDLKISVFYRNDESGTTENVSKYLKAAAPTVMTAEPSKKYFGTAGEGKKGTQGVADAVKGVEGGFGYMEWKYATDAQLSSAQLDNGDGAVPLNAETAGKAIAGATVVGEGNDLKLELKYTDLGTGVYPMVMVTYEIVCSAGLPADQGAVIKDFLTFASSTQAQATLEAQGYAPLPSEVQAKVAKAVSELK